MNMHVAVHARAHQLDPQTQIFAADVLDGLSQPQKSLSPKYFYDDAGSELFVEITKLPEYYPTRTELGILRDRAGEIAALIPPNAAIVEFGAGATTKIRILLAAHKVAAYVPVDISGDFITAQAEGLRRDFPDLAVYPVAADFTEPFELPGALRELPKVGFFPGSTLGNFEPQEAAHFLASARGILGQGAQLIIGVDLEKDERLLVPAYDDSAGVTAKFNLNVLERINRELGGDLEVPSFRHRAIYNRDQHRIEMHLVSLREQNVRILGEDIAFRAGETIHTENSYKYSLPRFRALAQESGWTLKRSWTDADGLFSVHALEAQE
ncbi:L-histidine N(alpha)-methyltransferase [Rhodopseudomonas pseudopalustris]|uniref:Dimethylhistidine N-methyltransferase n=1 Tax=Rhodopseudomonas pseudopalustris TaxID=1513892 RepID=A0A1H8RNF6_9BRAD|nr:L-histidine N(alpha)-methyltransferase [Rhodopseudomonas pseudopalustris]SEO67910.1 dimethylhistidine N-methyltransferase [Rhodopseudomonas pseudopalustris]